MPLENAKIHTRSILPHEFGKAKFVLVSLFIFGVPNKSKRQLSFLCAFLSLNNCAHINDISRSGFIVDWNEFNDLIRIR